MRSAIFLLAVFVSLSVQAQTYSAPQNGAKYVHLKEASVRRVLPGRPEVPINYEYKITITWLSSEKPGAFYWYHDNKWRTCLANRYGEPIEDLQRITKGDVLDLIPIEYKDAPLKKFNPKENTILFKTKKNNWRYIVVKTLVRKPDVAMP